MLWIRDTSSTPSEGWQYPAIQGPPIKTGCYQQLQAAVERHYNANAKTPPTKEAVDLWLCQNTTIPCYEGSAPFRNKFTDPPSYASRGLVGPDWPWILVPLKLLAQPEDRGLGDIVARTIGPIGGDAYKAWYLTIFGKSCGCDERQESLNTIFPL